MSFHPDSASPIVALHMCHDGMAGERAQQSQLEASSKTPCSLVWRFMSQKTSGLDGRNQVFLWFGSPSISLNPVRGHTYGQNNLEESLNQPSDQWPWGTSSWHRGFEAVQADWNQLSAGILRHIALSEEISLGLRVSRKIFERFLCWRIDIQVYIYIYIYMNYIYIYI